MVGLDKCDLMSGGGGVYPLPLLPMESVLATSKARQRRGFERRARLMANEGIHALNWMAGVQSCDVRLPFAAGTLPVSKAAMRAQCHAVPWHHRSTAAHVTGP